METIELENCKPLVKIIRHVKRANKIKHKSYKWNKTLYCCGRGNAKIWAFVHCTFSHFFVENNGSPTTAAQHWERQRKAKKSYGKISKFACRFKEKENNDFRKNNYKRVESVTRLAKTTFQCLLHLENIIIKREKSLS